MAREPGLPAAPQNSTPNSRRRRRAQGSPSRWSAGVLCAAAVFLSLFLLTTAATTRAAVDAPWPTYAQNPQRTGTATDQTTFTGISLGWEQSLDGAVYGQPLLFFCADSAATENNTVYAFDASTGSAKWQRS